MRLSVFIAFIVVSAIAVVIVSYIDGVSLGNIALRIIAVIVSLQVAYFLLLLIAAALPMAKKTSTRREKTHSTNSIPNTKNNS